MVRSQVGIVIPAFNEEDTIGRIVRECQGYGVPIVVDDGSSDCTGEVSRREGAELVSHAVNRGYDAALNSGFAKAADIRCKFVITIDADGQHDAELIGKMVSLLEQDADIVIGNRDRRQRFAEHCFAFLTKALYGISDPLCGLKGYRMKVYEALGHFDSYDSIGTELALFAVRNGFRAQQIPIIVRERDGSPRFGRKLQANYKIFRAMVLAFHKTHSVNVSEKIKGTLR